MNGIGEIESRILVRSLSMTNLGILHSEIRAEIDRRQKEIGQGVPQPPSEDSDVEGKHEHYAGPVKSTMTGRMQFNATDGVEELGAKLSHLDYKGLCRLMAAHDIAEYKLRKRVEHLEARHQDARSQTESQMKTLYEQAHEFEQRLRSSDSLIKTLFAMNEKQNINRSNLERAHNELNGQLNLAGGVVYEIASLKDRVKAIENFDAHVKKTRSRKR